MYIVAFLTLFKLAAVNGHIKAGTPQTAVSNHLIPHKGMRFNA
jgi:hypothetical protein